MYRFSSQKTTSRYSTVNNKNIQPDNSDQKVVEELTPATIIQVEGDGTYKHIQPQTHNFHKSYQKIFNRFQVASQVASQMSSQMANPSTTVPTSEQLSTSLINKNLVCP